MPGWPDPTPTSPAFQSQIIGLRVTEQFKQFLQDQAEEENRTLSNFIENAVLHYIKEQKNIDYKKDKKKTKK